VIFAVAFGGMFIGIILILLIARFSPDAAKARALEQRRKDEREGKTLHPGMPFEEWRHLVIDLLEALGFHIALEHSSATELDVIAKSTEPLRGGRYIVHAVLQPAADVVDQTQIIRLQEAVKGEGAAKGILFTPYQIDMTGLTALEAPLELIDGKKMRELIEKYIPKKLDVIEGYRGF
jgi:hypothetical protein